MTEKVEKVAKAKVDNAEKPAKKTTAKAKTKKAVTEEVTKKPEEEKNQQLALCNILKDLTISPDTKSIENQDQIINGNYKLDLTNIQKIQILSMKRLIEKIMEETRDLKNYINIIISNYNRQPTNGINIEDDYIKNIANIIGEFETKFFKSFVIREVMLESEDYALAKDAVKGLYILASELCLFPLYEALLDIYEDLEFETYDDVLKHYEEMMQKYNKIRGIFNA